MAKSQEKKRKKAVEERSEPIDVKIKAIAEDPDQKLSPIIGYFPSGYDPLKNSDDPNSDHEHGSNIKVYKNANSRNPRNPRIQVVVGVSGSHVNFVGTNYSGEATTPQLCNYALGVFDKESGVLKMVSVTANRDLGRVLVIMSKPKGVEILRMEPKIVGFDHPENEPPDEAKGEVTTERADKFRKLTLMYSTKKNIRRDEKRETLRQTEDPGKQENMDQKLKGIKINTKAVEAIASMANAQNIPPYDLEAAVADKAYPLDRIILKGEWDYLLDIFELAQAGLNVDPEVYPSFICNRFHKLESLKDETKKRRMAGVLSYITHLVRFKDNHSMDGVSSAKRHKLPNILLQKFSSMFGNPNDKRIPDEKQKLLISYVLVLSLFVDDFCSDPSDMARDLRINPITLRTHYEYLGCKFVRRNHVLVATLPVPLEFQTIKRKRRR